MVHFLHTLDLLLLRSAGVWKVRLPVRGEIGWEVGSSMQFESLAALTAGGMEEGGTGEDDGGSARGADEDGGLSTAASSSGALSSSCSTSCCSNPRTSVGSDKVKGAKAEKALESAEVCIRIRSNSLV